MCMHLIANQKMIFLKLANHTCSYIYTFPFKDKNFVTLETHVPVICLTECSKH